MVLVTGIRAAGADTVILKSGEMFQTQRAWKEKGVVNYYHNGQVVRVDERDVERLIHSPAPFEDNQQPQQRPAPDDPFTPRSGSAAGQPFSQRQPFDDRVGYLDLRWGQPLSQIEGLTAIEADPAYGGVPQYVKSHANQRFGRARVDDIVYGFWQDRLYTITVWSSNFLDFRDLKAEAFRRFGEGIRNREDVEKYYWVAQGSDRMLAYDDASDTGYLWMRSRALHEQVRERYPD